VTTDVVQVSPLWSVAAVVLLLGLASAAAGLSGALTARAGGGAAGAGIGMPLRETARLLRQRRRSTVAADRVLWRTGGAGLLVTAVLMIAVVPLGRWTLADLDVGVVWFNAMDVLVWAAVWLTGWGANSAHGLVGAYRFLAQALAYELPLMFALTVPVAAAGSLRVGDLVAAQQHLWFVVWMPVAFAVFCVAIVAFSAWGPFAHAADSDIAGGVLTELSAVDRLLVLVGRYALLTAGAAFAVPVFLGGGAGPVLPGWLWVLVKTALLLAVLVTVREKVPTVRPEPFATTAWMVALPAVLVQVLVVAVIVVGR